MVYLVVWRCCSGFGVSDSFCVFGCSLMLAAAVVWFNSVVVVAFYWCVRVL